MPVDCRCSHCPVNLPGLVSRSELKAIQRPSGDQLGRKLPERLLVRLRSLWLAMSSSQRFAKPSPLVEMNARLTPSGDSEPWSWKEGSSVNCSRPDPSG